MKKVTLTISEYTNSQNEKKKKRVNVGRIHQYAEGGEAIVLDAALCATIAAKAQAALIAGEDSIWLSIFEDTPKGDNSYNSSPEYNQAPQHQTQAAPAPSKMAELPPTMKSVIDPEDNIPF